MKSILTFCALFLALIIAAPSVFAQTHLAEKGFVLVGVTDIASVTVGTAGTGYTSAPTVAFTGGGALGGGATGTSRLKAVGSITVTAGGTGYTVGDVLTLVGGTKTTTATFTVSTVSTGVVTAVTITNAGVYTVPVTTTGAATTGGTGSGCTLTVGWGVASVVVTNSGHGFTSAPTVAFSGGGGSSAAATATLTTITATEVKFRSIIPLSSTVIDEIELPARTYDANYSGDSDVEGVTLAAGIEYPVYGNSILLESGLAILILR